MYLLPHKRLEMHRSFSHGNTERKKLLTPQVKLCLVNLNLQLTVKQLRLIKQQEKKHVR